MKRRIIGIEIEIVHGEERDVLVVKLVSCCSSSLLSVQGWDEDMGASQTWNVFPTLHVHTRTI